MPQLPGHAIWFVGPKTIEIREAQVSEPEPDEILVRATKSLISAGTEMLIYRGQTNAGDRMPPNSEGRFPFPTKYGYQIVGEVVEAGSQSGFAVGDHVFARHPHQDLFTIKALPNYVTKLPKELDDASATFINLARVGLTGLLDVPVRLGEFVVVFGQGIVGMMCARMAALNAGATVVVDPFPRRRELASKFGFTAVVGPDEVADVVAELSGGRGADVVFEASGSPQALQSAIHIAADRGEIVAVAMYGDRDVPLRLVPEFHYRRLRITSSQAADQVRWDWPRRTEATVGLLQRLPVAEMITHSVPFQDAAHAYDLVDSDPANVLGVVLDYTA